MDSSRVPRAPAERLLGLIATMFVLLGIQNGAGIWINLFITVNDTASYAGVYPAMFQSAPGALHTVVGVLIGANAILMLVLSRTLLDRRVPIISAVILGLVALAAYSGFHFVQSGGDNFYSALMEYSFMVIVLLEALALYLVTRAITKSAPTMLRTDEPRPTAGPSNNS